MEEAKVAVQSVRKKPLVFPFFWSLITILVSRLVLGADGDSTEVWQQIGEWEMKCLQMYASDAVRFFKVETI